MQDERPGDPAGGSVEKGLDRPAAVEGVGHDGGSGHGEGDAQLRGLAAGSRDGDGQDLVGVPAGGEDLDLEDVGALELPPYLGAEPEVEDLGGREGPPLAFPLGGGDLDGQTGAAGRVPAPPGPLADGAGLGLGEENEGAEDQHWITSVLYAVDDAGFG